MSDKPKPIIVKQYKPPFYRRKTFWTIGAVFAFLHFFPALHAYADASATNQSWFAWFFSACLNAIESFFDWQLSALLALIEPVLSDLLDAIPQSWHVVTTPLFEWTSLANYYFPVAEAIALCGIFSVWYLVVVLFRLVKSCIPTVSGGG